MKKISNQALKYPVIGLLLTLLTTFCQANTILIFGDSLSAGYGLQEKEDWPYLLKKRLLLENFTNYKVVNASISGETTDGGLNRFSDTFKKHKPQIVFLELGANDGLRGQSIKKMRNNLNKMIQYSLDNNSQVILAGMRIPPNYGKRYTETFYQSFQQLATQHKISLIPFFLDGLMARKSMIQKDGLHPTAKAQAILAERVWKIIKPMLLLPEETVTLDNYFNS